MQFLKKNLYQKQTVSNGEQDARESHVSQIWFSMDCVRRMSIVAKEILCHVVQPGKVHALKNVGEIIPSLGGVPGNGYAADHHSVTMEGIEILTIKHLGPQKSITK
nr:PREDICTED: uncharacterized protein LOC100562699 isoform X2 [Anolis carolinensis]|eukprot:XP_003225606.1 PREDICTED: uncharacterized protein LOC100562699 isoform X2 [Anolis carolinensis]